MNKYPLPIPKHLHLLRLRAVKVYNQMQYETIVDSHGYETSVAGFAFKDIKKNKDGTICENEFPLFVQLCWLPWCGNHVRATKTHKYFKEYDDVPKYGGIQ